jgi:hypothetical protein
MGLGFSTGWQMQRTHWSSTQHMSSGQVLVELLSHVMISAMVLLGNGEGTGVGRVMVGAGVMAGMLTVGAGVVINVGVPDSTGGKVWGAEVGAL